MTATAQRGGREAPHRHWNRAGVTLRGAAAGHAPCGEPLPAALMAPAAAQARPRGPRSLRRAPEGANELALPYDAPFCYAPPRCVASGVWRAQRWWRRGGARRLRRQLRRRALAAASGSVAESAASAAPPLARSRGCRARGCTQLRQLGRPPAWLALRRRRRRRHEHKKSLWLWKLSPATCAAAAAPRQPLSPSSASTVRGCRALQHPLQRLCADSARST